MINFRKYVSLRSLAVAVCLAGFCAGPGIALAWTPPARTLPSYVKRIYIREFKNNSRVFGAQADLTLYVNDEFMLDGRLDVVQSGRSDVRREGKIKFIREESTGLSSDEFPLISMMQMETIVELWDPYDPDRLAPLYRFNVQQPFSISVTPAAALQRQIQKRASACCARQPRISSIRLFPELPCS